MIDVLSRVAEEFRSAAERREFTCDQCFFRRAELCALPGNRICPTFRPAATAAERLVRRGTPSLASRPLGATA